MYPINQAMLDALNRPVYQEAHISFTVNGTTYNFDNGDIIRAAFMWIDTAQVRTGRNLGAR